MRAPPFPHSPCSVPAAVGSSVEDESLAAGRELLKALEDAENQADTRIRQAKGWHLRALWWKLKLGFESPRAERVFDSLLTAVFTVLLGVPAVFLTFWAQRAAESADLTIEYVFWMHEDEDLPEPIQSALLTLTKQSNYSAYAMSNRGRYDLGLLSAQMGGATSISHKALLMSLTAYSEFLNAKKRMATAEREQLPQMSDNDLSILAFRNLENSFGLNMQQMREQLDAHYEATARDVELSITEIEAIKTKIAVVPRLTRLKVSVLNKGATDGLVRQKGEVCYNKIWYEIVSAEPPTKAPTRMAVPTFLTNQPDSIMSGEAVGKAEKDAMTDFWYKVKRGTPSQERPLGLPKELCKTASSETSADVCGEGGTVAIFLHDQNIELIQGKNGWTTPCYVGGI